MTPMVSRMACGLRSDTEAAKANWPFADQAEHLAFVNLEGNIVDSPRVTAVTTQEGEAAQEAHVKGLNRDQRSFQRTEVLGPTQPMGSHIEGCLRLAGA